MISRQREVQTSWGVSEHAILRSYSHVRRKEEMFGGSSVPGLRQTLIKKDRMGLNEVI